jgi:hypothetical protein
LRAAQEAFEEAVNELNRAMPTSRDLRENWRLASEAIQKAPDIARAAQEAYEEALDNLEEAIGPAIDPPDVLPTTAWIDLRGVDLRGHDVKSIVELANKMAKDERDEFTKL